MLDLRKHFTYTDNTQNNTKEKELNGCDQSQSEHFGKEKVRIFGGNSVNEDAVK